MSHKDTGTMKISATTAVPTASKEIQQIETLPFTGMAQQHMMSWNATEQPVPLDLCIPQLVERQAAATPEALAVTMQDQQLNYRELNQQANQLAHHLRAFGVAPNVFVGICLERSIDLVIGLLAILKAGGAYVPIDPSYPEERITFMVNDTGISLLLTKQSIAAQRLPTQGTRMIFLDSDRALLAQKSQSNPPSTISVDDLAYVIYTSGSTGRPKGVQISHRNILNLVGWYHQAFELTPTYRTTQFASPAFDVITKELWPPLTVGASIHIIDEKIRTQPIAIRDWLVSHEITLTILPTILAESLIALEWPATTSLRFLLTGGDVLQHYAPPTLPFTLINNYGPTEATVVATYERVPSNGQELGLPSIGRPIANTQIYILDEHLHQVPIGEAGEMYIGGYGLAQGYLNRPELTAEKFIRNPFSTDPSARLYKTGDLVRSRPDGRIDFVGRSDQQVKIRGYRIELNEIVATLNTHPAIETSVVIAREDTPGNKRLVAYLVLLPDTHITAALLRDHLLAHLPEYMIPSTFVVLDSFPLTSSRKVDHAALPAPTTTTMLWNGVIIAPTTPTEERLAGIMASILGVEQVSIDDDFFALGGHSLAATQLITQIASTFAIEIPLSRVFETPTVRQLATEIEQRIVARLESMSEEEILQLLQQEQFQA